MIVLLLLLVLFLFMGRQTKWMSYSLLLNGMYQAERYLILIKVYSWNNFKN